jgi:hypothetical protein
MTAPEAPAREALRAHDITVQQFDALAEPLHGAPGMAVMLRRTRRELTGTFPVAMDERSRETPTPLNRPWSALGRLWLAYPSPSPVFGRSGRRLVVGGGVYAASREVIGDGLNPLTMR